MNIPSIFIYGKKGIKYHIFFKFELYKKLNFIKTNFIKYINI